jgi:hypothetical protein
MWPVRPEIDERQRNRYAKGQGIDDPRLPDLQGRDRRSQAAGSGVSESQHQRALIEWARRSRATYPELRMLFAIPNGGKRNPVTAAVLKAEGVLAGVPDLCLPVKRGPYGGLWIELKRPREGGKVGGVLTESQRAYQGDLMAFGQCVGTCWGWLEAKTLIEAYLRGEA